MEGKAKVMLSKSKYYQFEAALQETFDSDTVTKITTLLQSTFSFDPNASQYDKAQAQRIANYRRKLKEKTIEHNPHPKIAT